MKRQIIYACLGILLGCSSPIPKDDNPLTTLPKQWRKHDRLVKLAAVKLNTLAWWETFHDPHLNALIRESLTHNNDLEMATGNLLQARASLRKVQASWLPTLTLGAFGITSQVSNFTFKLPSTPLPPFKQTDAVLIDGYAAGFLPSYTLNVMRQYKMGQAARLSISLQEIYKDAVRLGVISQVAGSYFSLVGLREQLMLQRQMVKDAQALRQYKQIQYQNGAISQQDIVLLDQFIASLEKKIPVLQHDIHQIENALNVMRDKSMGVIHTRHDFTAISTQEVIPIHLPSAVLKARPDVAMSYLQLKLQHTMVAVTASELFPAFNLTGLLGTASVELSSLLRFSNSLALGEAVGLMPLLNLGIYADIVKAKGALYTAYYQYVKTVRHAFADVDNALSRHETVNQSYAQQLQALKAAQDQYALVKEQYHQGMISYATTINAKLNVDYMQALLNEAKMQQLASIVNLYQALGGGYCA